jgi:hypothetical protein
MKKLKEEDVSQMKIFRNEASVAPVGIVEGLVSEGLPSEWNWSVAWSRARIAAEASLACPDILVSNVFKNWVLRKAAEEDEASGE